VLARMALAVRSAGVGRVNVQRLCSLGVPLELALPVADYYGADAEDKVPSVGWVGGWAGGLFGVWAGG
jgi:hypothetical protein